MWRAGALLASLAAVTATLPAQSEAATVQATPIGFGETFTIHSGILGEDRVINVYVPPSWDEEPDARRPVLYMPDGGMAEDFLHIAGLLQVSVGNGSVAPVILVGIENTERRRDLTGPTTVARDSAIAPRVGGSVSFRRFIREELIPLIESRYATTTQRGIIGESLAGLFVVETLLLEPDLFDTYVAFDPSLWWNNAALNSSARDLLRRMDSSPRTLHLASSSEPELASLALELVEVLRAHAPASLAWSHREMPDESHATIYHPAALVALRTVYKP